MVDFADMTDIELAVLQRALLEARFCERNRDDLVWLSPVLTELHEGAVRVAVERARASGKEREVRRWESWLDWSRHVVEQRILADKLAREEAWAALPDDEARRAFLRGLLRPFEVSDEALTQTIALVQQTRAASIAEVDEEQPQGG